MNQAEKDILHYLLYFDVFSYPLRREELFIYCGMEAGQEAAFEGALSHLTGQGLVHEHQGYFMIGMHNELVARRIAGNNRAAARMQTARRYARLISWFPFVRGVFLSGSISKGYMNKSDDIDYFIVTQPSRLWLVRTMLTIFKKLFLLNSYRNFCINYFVDTEHMEVTERNRFTATEIVFLLPVFGSQHYQNMLDINKWTKKYYPLFRQNGDICRNSSPMLKRWLESLLNLCCANRLEKAALNRSVAYIRKKYNDLSPSMFDKCFTLEPHELKYLPRCQQGRIMRRYTAKKKIFFRRYGVSLERALSVEHRAQGIGHRA